MDMLTVIAIYLCCLTGAIGSLLIKVMNDGDKDMSIWEFISYLMIAATGPGALAVAGCVYLDRKLTGFEGV
jgi:hypothetical protein